MEGRLREQERRGFTPTREFIEEDWIRELAKHLAPAAVLRREEVVETVLGRFCFDLWLELGSLRVGFTVVQSPGSRVLEGVWEDAAVLGPGLAHVIYRLRAIDLRNHLHDCLYAVYLGTRRLLSERGQTNVQRLASDAVASRGFDGEELVVHYSRECDEDLGSDPSGDPEDVIVEARPRETEGSLYLVRRTQAQMRRNYAYVLESRERTATAVLRRFTAELREAEPDE